VGRGGGRKGGGRRREGGGKGLVILKAASDADFDDLRPVPDRLDRRVVVLDPLTHARLVGEQNIVLPKKADHAAEAVALWAMQPCEHFGQVQGERQLLE